MPQALMLKMKCYAPMRSSLLRISLPAVILCFGLQYSTYAVYTANVIVSKPKGNAENVDNLSHREAKNYDQ